MEHVRKLSKQLFGALYRLEVGAALHAGQLITATSMAEELGKPPSPSCVSKELEGFEDAGLLVRQPKVNGMRSVYLLPVDTPFWDTCRALVAQATKTLDVTGDARAGQGLT